IPRRAEARRRAKPPGQFRVRISGQSRHAQARAARLCSSGEPQPARPVILTMLFIFSRISARAMQLSQMLQQFASAVPAHAEFLRLEAELAAHDAPKTRPAPAIGPSAIVFRDVSFHDLLLGLLEPDAGEITVGAAVIRSTAAIKWRDHVSYVVQEPCMFRDTLRRNLLWANPQANDAGSGTRSRSPRSMISWLAWQPGWTPCLANVAR